MTPKEQITELKCIAPKIDFLIEEADSEEAITFYYKRLLQLAKKAKDKYVDMVDNKKN